MKWYDRVLIYIVSALFIAAMLCLIYTVGAPVVQGIREYGIVAFIYAILCGAIIGCAVYGTPALLVWLWKFARRRRNNG